LLLQGAVVAVATVLAVVVLVDIEQLLVFRWLLELP
jgi:hypothetical protein